MKIYILCSVLLLLCACDAYKILTIFPLTGKSHSILAEAVVNHLLNAGHEVTFIQGFRMKSSHPNLTQVLPKANAEFVDEGINIKQIMDKEMDLSDNGAILHIMHMDATKVIKDEVVQNLLKDTSRKFDLVIAEWMFSNIHAGLHAIYGCPLIWFSTVEPHWQVMRLVDEALNPSYNPDVLSNIVPPFSFLERVKELKEQITTMMAIRHFMDLERKVYESFIVPHIKLRGREVPNYEDVVFNASLLFGNSHVSMGQATRLPQSYKSVGGYHVSTEVKPLPADLKKLLDEAKDGLIYFSMGSNLRSKYMPDSLKKELLKVFGELKQTVLWKFEEVMTDLPKNVHIVTWAPQQSILAHPNTVLFITHGGLLSTIEALYSGKPIIGIPVFADQFTNVERAVLKGFARKVNLAYSMEKELRAELQEVLGNPKYAEKARYWSVIYHDRPVSPARELIHWTEHVIKLGGAHLRSAALHLPWYQKVYLDLAALLLVALVAVVVLLKTAWKWLRSGKSDKKKRA